MNWKIKIVSKTLMTKISHISWGGYDKGGYDKGFYGIKIKNGYYFNQHYMHDKLWVWYILINSNIFDKLLPIIEDLKQMKSIKDDARKSWKVKNIGSTILDKILFRNIGCFKIKSNHLVLTENLEKYFLDQNSSPENISFKRMYFVYLDYYFEKTLSILQDIGNFGIQIEFLFIWGSSEEELEKLTNPAYYINGLSKFFYHFKKDHALSEKFFLNINQLQPQEITFEGRERVEGSYDYIDILK